MLKNRDGFTRLDDTRVGAEKKNGGVSERPKPANTFSFWLSKLFGGAEQKPTQVAPGGVEPNKYPYPPAVEIEALPGEGAPPSHTAAGQAQYVPSKQVRGKGTSALAAPAPKPPEGEIDSDVPSGFHPLSASGDAAGAAGGSAPKPPTHK